MVIALGVWGSSLFIHFSRMRAPWPCAYRAPKSSKLASTKPCVTDSTGRNRDGAPPAARRKTYARFTGAARTRAVTTDVCAGCGARAGRAW
eukprot:7234589-Prymnesium_polylepis.1